MSDVNFAQNPSEMPLSHNGTARSAKIEARLDSSVPMVIDQRSGAVIYNSVDQMQEMAKRLAIAGIGVPKHLRDQPALCLVVVVQANEWGFTPYSLAAASHVINDKLGYEAKVLAAVIQKRAPIKGRLKYTFSGEGTTRKCTCWAVLREDLQTEPNEKVDYETPAIGGINPKNSPLWTKDPDQQLCYYAARGLSRRHFPDILLGVLAIDEIQDETPMRVIGDNRDATSAGEALAARLESHAANGVQPDRKFDRQFVDDELNGGRVHERVVSNGAVTSGGDISGEARSTGKVINAEAIKQAEDASEAKEQAEKAEASAQRDAEEIAAQIHEETTGQYEGPTIAEMQADHQALVDEEDDAEEDDWSATIAGFEARVTAIMTIAELQDFGLKESQKTWYTNASEERRNQASAIFNEHLAFLQRVEKDRAKAAKKSASAKSTETPAEAPSAPDATIPAAEPEKASSAPPPAQDEGFDPNVIAMLEAAAKFGSKRYRLKRGGLAKDFYDAFVGSDDDKRIEALAKAADNEL